MTKHRKQLLISLLIILSVLIIDQVIKIAVKTSMYTGERVEICSWFKLLFIENNGMAFGWELGGKYFLTSFRIIAVALIGWFIVRTVKRGAPTGFIVCLSLVLAGAAGNIIDCLFYGVIFNAPAPPDVAQFVSPREGYSSIMLGRVVDMFYFPLVEWEMPDWGWVNSLPLVPQAGEHCVFFSAIFNFADAVISCSIVALFCCYHKRLSLSLASKADEKESSEKTDKDKTSTNPDEKEISTNSDEAETKAE